MPNAFIEDLMPKMIDDMLKLMIDPVFPPEKPSTRQENDYELLYCTHHSKYSDKPINRRRDFQTPNYPIKELSQGKNPIKQKPEKEKVEHS